MCGCKEQVGRDGHRGVTNDYGGSDEEAMTALAALQHEYPADGDDAGDLPKAG